MKFKFNGKQYYARYHHVRIGHEEWHNRLLECLTNAINFGQIDIHACDKRYLEKSSLHNVFSDYYAPLVFNGATICEIENESREIIARGYSFCSANDQFNKKVGRQIAFGRAKKELIKSNTEQEDKCFASVNNLNFEDAT